MCPNGQEAQDLAPSCSVISVSGHLIHLLALSSRYVPAVHFRAEANYHEPKFSNFELMVVTYNLW